MARVNVDGTALVDPRFDRLAMLLGLADGDHARGKMIRLWITCVLQSSHVAGRWLVENVLGVSGPEALVISELANWASEDHQSLYLRGTQGRIEWYQRLRNQAASAGKARAANASRAAGRFTSHKGDDVTSALALAPSLALALVNKNSATNAVAPKNTKRKADANEDEMRIVRAVLASLSKHNGVNYSGSGEHTRLIVAHLRRGVTEHDLRKVVAYCAERVFPESNADLRVYLRPETLFGPRTIERYLDPARSWFDTLPGSKP